MPITLSEVEKAWLAAAIDGEGHIMFFRVKCRDKFYIRTGIGLTNCSFEFLERAKNIIGKGHVSLKGKTGYKNWKVSWKTCYFYQLVHQQTVYDILTEILPYLIVKKDKAKAVIAFLESRLKMGSARGRYRMYTEKELAVCRASVPCP